MVLESSGTHFDDTIEMFLVPILILVISLLLAYPLGWVMNRVLDRSVSGPVERLLNTGPQNASAYLFSLLAFNSILFALGFLFLTLQPWLPLNADGMNRVLAPSTIFNTACSFLTNTNLQHYSGEVHLSYFSQLFVICWKQFVTPAIGLSALLAMIRGLRGDLHLGNFYVDTWRSLVWILLPLSLLLGVGLLMEGVPMTLQGAESVSTLEGGQQTIARGPVAAIVAIKQLGTNGGGFFGANSSHPFGNPSAWSNFLECLAILLLPMACPFLFGRMIGNPRHGYLLSGVMGIFLITLMGWAIATDTMQPNPGLRGLPVDQTGMGNMEGKELRFGPSAGATWAAITTCTSNGSVNCMHDSLNPLAGLAPLMGMWLNCIFGGVGVGLINLLVYLITAVFLGGLMVGRTPEYLGKKVEAREMKLAMLALLIHPILILVPAGLIAPSVMGAASTTNPGPHGLSQIIYELTSASANNGSGFEGLKDTWGFYEDSPAPYAWIWDLSTGLIMMINRFVPIITPILLAASLSGKRPTPFTAGTLRTETLTFGVVLLGTILLVGALLFLPVAVLGPVAEHLGPLPFRPGP